MGGDERVQDGMLSYVSLEQRVSQDHQLRAVRKLTDTVLGTLSPEFDVLYADSGRPSMAVEALRSITDNLRSGERWSFPLRPQEATELQT